METRKEELKYVMDSIIDKAGYPPEFVKGEIRSLVKELSDAYFYDLNIVFDLSNPYVWINKEIIVEAVDRMPKEFQNRVSYLEDEDDLENVVRSLNDTGITFEPCQSSK